MLGQDPTPVHLPERIANPKELAKWDHAVELMHEVSDRLDICLLLNINAAATYRFSETHGGGMSKPIALEQRLLNLESDVKRVKNLMRQVEDHELGINFSKGDINIVKPEQPDNMGFIGIVVGGLILLGLVGTLLYYRDQTLDIRPKYNALLKATDKMFCKKSSPETCAEWKAYREESGYTKRMGIVDQIADGLKRIGKPAAKYAAFIAIPIILLVLAWKR